MKTDQAQMLREEALSPHSLFHQYALLQSKASLTTYFLFFEGVDDPTFYVGHIIRYLGQRPYYEFVCNGRDRVLKVHELCARDGRAMTRTLFFVDKDHTDLQGAALALPHSVFQTECYSFENYIVSQHVFRRFWTERLHLRITDDRFQSYSDRLHTLHGAYVSRMRLLMAIVLIGRGIDGRSPSKLNLNNVALEKVISVNIEASRVTWKVRGGQNFLAASNMTESGVKIRGEEVRQVYRKYLRGRDPKCFVRGKYELWFFVKFLALASRALSDKQSSKLSGKPRATPGDIICSSNSLDSLSGLTLCPQSLDEFLAARIPAH